MIQEDVRFIITVMISGKIRKSGSLSCIFIEDLVNFASDSNNSVTSFALSILPL